MCWRRNRISGVGRSEKGFAVAVVASHDGIGSAVAVVTMHHLPSRRRLPTRTCNSDTEHFYTELGARHDVLRRLMNRKHIHAIRRVQLRAPRSRDFAI